MEPGTTTIKVYKQDKERLTSLFGTPTHEAFNKLMDKCPHPEEHRQYTTAWIKDQSNSFGGFYCRVCKSYIFQVDLQVAEGMLHG